MIYELFRWLAIVTGYPAYLLFFKTKVYYEDKAVQSRRVKGGALVISNHFGVVDYIVNMFVLLPRKLCVVSAEYPFRNKFLRWGMKPFGGIQAHRPSKSMRFIDDSVEAINRGDLVQIFPEAHNTPDGSIQPFKPSYLMIALRANAPIVPIVTDGNYGLFKRVHVLIGKQIDLSEYCTSKNPSREEIVAMNEAVYQRVVALKSRLDAMKAK